MITATLLRDHRQQFANHMAEYGLGTGDLPLDDGSLHRFRVEGDKPGTRNGWYVLFGDGVPAGCVGSWKSGEVRSWCAKSYSALTQDEREANARRMEAARAQRQQEVAKAQCEAKAHALKLWREAIPATHRHPYIQSKGISATGLRQLDDVLLVPLSDISGALVNLQRIYPDGNKRFLKGGRVSGAFWLTGATETPCAGVLYVCEGVATAATVAKAIKGPVVAAMNANNLKPVMRAIYAEHPALSLVVCADNDWRTQGNPGITKAREAAEAVHGAITWPTVCMEEDCRCTDFNDIERCGRAGK